MFRKRIGVVILIGDRYVHICEASRLQYIHNGCVGTCTLDSLMAAGV